MGLAVIACVLAVRLVAFAWQPLAQWLSRPETAAFLVYLETGRRVKLPVRIQEATLPCPTEPELPPETQPQQTEPQQQISFQPEDAQLVQVSNLCGYAVDTPELLLSGLEWDLTAPEPTVLILHSHATESYTKTQQASYVASSAYRTLDTQHNMVRVGQELKAALEAGGIQVIHDTTLHDYPSYTDAYINSRAAVQKYLAEYPNICMVLDLHRDASELSGGDQLQTLATVDGTDASQLMLVVGTNAGGRNHPDWEQNMALAVKLHAQLEKRYPGICRPISFRTERFNQDLCPGALIVEVGAAGDTLEDALVAVRALAQGICQLAQGAATAGSTS